MRRFINLCNPNCEFKFAIALQKLRNLFDFIVPVCRFDTKVTNGCYQKMTFLCLNFDFLVLKLSGKVSKSSC